MNNKIRLISQSLKWSVLFLSILTLAYLLFSYFVYGDFNFQSDDPIFIELWGNNNANRAILIASTLPSFALWMISIYWLFKIFSHFERGDYFSQKSMASYIWLVWIHVSIFVNNLLFSIWLTYYHSQFYGKTEAHINVSLSQLFTLFFLVSIVHILRAARDVEQENKEFI